jgi:hypothetical protein
MLRLLGNPNLKMKFILLMLNHHKVLMIQK